jgi:AbrB family looped-hinge helix DNA binding protein
MNRVGGPYRCGRGSGRRPLPDGCVAPGEQPLELRGNIDPFGVRRYLTEMRSTVSSKGQIVLPAAMRRRDGIRPGQHVEIERIDRGEYRLIVTDPPPNEGFTDWLLECPAKGYFVPIESESTDTL